MNDDLDKVQLTEAYMHEACDRAHIVSSMFDDFLLQHPAVLGVNDLKKKAESISESLAEFYQMCGAELCDFDEEKEIIVDLSCVFKK